MRRVTFHYVIKNHSRYPIDSVWENAQDLEHVSRLHPKTNRAFEILAKTDSAEFAYETLVFRTSRRLFCFGISTTGFRRIVQRYQLHQIEWIPIFRMKVILNSVLKPATTQGFLTELCDEVLIEVPALLSFLKPYFAWSLKRHTQIQCAEDEPFRERRMELSRRGISLPLSLFSVSALDKASGLWRESPQGTA